RTTSEDLPRIHWEEAVGFVLLLAGVMGIEALQMAISAAHLPAGAGGQLGQLLAFGMSLAFGHTGCTILLLGMVAVGASLFFRFSWLTVAERVGWFLETLVRRLIELKRARDDRRVGVTKKAERAETVVARQSDLEHE